MIYRNNNSFLPKSIWAFIILLTVPIFACPTPVRGEEVVAKVNRTEITRQELLNRARIDHLFMTLRGAPLFAEFLMETDQGQNALNHYRQYVLDKLIEEILITQKADEMNIEITSDEIEKRLNEIIKQTKNVQNREDLNEKLEEDRQNLADLKNEIHRRVAREKLRAKITSQVEVSSDEVKEYYKENKETFRNVNDQIQPLQEVRDVIRQRLQENKKHEAWKKWLSRVREEANIEKHLKS
ncbi:SurA N-terminal domain-containing protein [Candidatus Bipolaricaulota bacterium]|nr:SurA N-terminal domain-containing protein [Candidatus Bipolaricaulota bacterium]